jgi:RecJ-like exonuclease
VTSRLVFGLDKLCPACRGTGRRHVYDPRTGRLRKYTEKVGRRWLDFPCPACGGRGHTRETIVRHG